MRVDTEGGAVLVQLLILGRVRLSTDAGPVRLTELEHGLLALAALRGHVEVDSLAEWLWDGEPPSSVRNRVQALVSGIRRKAGPGVAVVVTDGRGYRLGDDVEVDLATWSTQVASARARRSGDAGRALAHYDAGLAVLGHDPLRGAPGTTAVELERSRLLQERLSVLEERHETALRAGAHDGLVAELDTLCARQPYHEGFTSLLMLALAATGQQRRALEVFREARTRLDAELGVRPSEQLVEAQRLVLAGTPVEAVDQPVVRGLPVPRTLPRRPDGFVGRAGELAVLTRAADALEHGPVVVAVTGLPGSGKSALALEAGHALRDRFPDGTLYHDGGNTPGGVPVEAVVSAFLPLLGVHPEAVPASPHARAGLFRSLLDGRRVLVVLDNVTGGDDDGPAGRIGDLLPVGSGSMAVVTSRRPVDGVPARDRVRLPGLGAGAARTLLESLVGSDRVTEAPEAVDDVVRLTGGMPLALRLAAGRLAQRPDLGLPDLAERLERLGSGGAHEITVLRESLDRVLEGLGSGARQAVEALAHLPADTASGWVVGALLGSHTAGDTALDAMLEAGLVEPVVREDHDTQYRLQDLVRSHVRGRSARGGRRGSAPAAHPESLREAVAVAEAAVARSALFLEDRPHRFVPVAPRPASLAPPDPRPRTRRRSRSFFRTETPLFVALARGVADDRPDLAWRLLADTALGTDASSDLRTWFDAARSIGTALGDGDDGRLGAAHLLLCRAWLLQDRLSVSREARELAEAARPRLLLLGAHDAAAAASLVSVQASTSLGHRTEAEAAVVAAEATIGRTGDPTLAAWAAIARGTLHNDYDELDEAAREFTRAREILHGSPRTVAYALATLELSRSRRRTGELAAATLLVDESLELLLGIEAVHMFSYALDARAEVSLAAGRPLEAFEESGTALERASASRDAFLTARARRTHARALLALGRLEDAEAALRTVVEEFTALDRPLSVAFTYQVLAATLDAAGDPVGASEALRLEQAALRRATASRADAPQRRSPGPA